MKTTDYKNNKIKNDRILLAEIKLVMSNLDQYKKTTIARLSGDLVKLG